MPWEKQYDEAFVLERAMEAFWDHGYEATSVSDLVAVTGINRGSLYAGFSDKRTLFMRALEHYDRTYRTDFLGDLAANHSPREAILAAFREVKASTEGGDRRGCLVVNTALELSPHDPGVADIVRDILVNVEAFFRDQVKAAQQAGTIDPALDANEMSQGLLALFLGLRVVSRSRPEPSLMAGIVKQAEVLLG